MAHLILSILLLLLVGAQATSIPCYYPNGKLASSDSPCNPSASSTDASVCCGPGWACLSNTLCMQTLESSDYDSHSLDTVYARPSCTDRQYASSACTYFCDQGPDAAVDALMTKCPSNTNDTYCCNSEPLCNCAIEDNIIDFTGYYTVETTIGDNIIDFTGYYTVETTIGVTSTSTRKSSTSTSSHPISSPSSLITSMSPTTIDTSIFTANTSPTPAPTSSAETVTPTPAASTSSNQALAIGLGASLPIILLALGGLAYFLYHRRQSRRTSAEYQTQNQTDSPPPPQYQAPDAPLQGIGGLTEKKDGPTEMAGESHVHELDSPQVREMHSPNVSRMGSRRHSRVPGTEIYEME